VGWWAGGLVGWWAGGLVGWWAGGLVGWWAGGLVGGWAGGLVGWWAGGKILIDWKSQDLPSIIRDKNLHLYVSNFHQTNRPSNNNSPENFPELFKSYNLEKCFGNGLFRIWPKVLPISAEKTNKFSRKP